MSKHKSASSDNELGIQRDITRRDFLNGVSVGMGGALALQAGLFAALDEVAFASDAEKSAANATGVTEYPPALTGLRGSYDATYKYAHMLRDDAFWDSAPTSADIVESYDLIVVGGGISGLAAAYFYRQNA